MANKSHHSNPPTHLLLIRLGALGDLIHLLPTLAALHRYLPHTQLHVLTSPLYVDFLSQIPDLPVQWWGFQKGRNTWQTMQCINKVASQLKAVGVDAVLNLHPSLKTYALACQVLEMGGFAHHHHVYQKQKLPHTGIAERPIPRRHAVDDFYTVAQKAYGLPALTHEDRIPVLPLEQVSMPVATEWHIGLIPGVGGKRPNRAWPLSHYAALVSQYQSQYTPTHPTHWHLIGGPEEKQLAAELEHLLRVEHPEISLVNHCNRLSIFQTAQQLAQCHVVVGGDTGPLHVAAAVGCNILGVYAPTSVKRTGPVTKPERYFTLTPPEALTCWPCEKPFCQKQAERCIAEISPGQAVDALVKLLPPLVLK